MGAKLVNAVAQKTSDVAGDGTTTATVLALAIYQEGLRNITAGANPMAVKRGIDKAVAKAVEHLEEKLSKKLTKKEEMQQVATISANNDPAIGKLMADAFEKVGKDGVITVEEGKTSETDARVRRGHAVRQGLHLAVLRRPTRRTLKCGAGERAHPHLREEDRATSARCCRCSRRSRRPASRCSSSPRTSRARRWRRSSSTSCAACSNVCAVKAPGFGDRRKAMLDDIAVLTGGTFISEDLGIKLENVTLEQLGQAKHGPRREGEHARSSTAPARSARGDQGARRRQIRTQMDQTESEYDKEKFSERLAKLTGGVAIIRSAPRPRPR